MAAAEHEVVGDVVGGRDVEGAAQIPALGVVAAVAGQPIERIAVVALVEPGQPERHQILDQRYADAALHVDRIEPAVIDREIGFGGVAGLARRQVDRAAGGVAAVERALRPAQHLDLLEIEEPRALRERRADIDAVDIDADRARGGRVEIVDADAPDEDARIGGAVVRLDLQAGRLVGEIDDIGDPAVADRVATDRGDGDGYVLKFFGALLRGDDDLADLGCAVPRR